MRNIREAHWHNILELQMVRVSMKVEPDAEEAVVKNSRNHHSLPGLNSERPFDSFIQNNHT
ncbi:MAG: hypothetical protein QXG05_07315 [Nitrososphaerota archaeon]